MVYYIQKSINKLQANIVQNLMDFNNWVSYNWRSMDGVHNWSMMNNWSMVDYSGLNNWYSVDGLNNWYYWSSMNNGNGVDGLNNWYSMNRVNYRCWVRDDRTVGYNGRVSNHWSD